MASPETDGKELYSIPRFIAFVDEVLRFLHMPLVVVQV